MKTNREYKNRRMMNIIEDLCTILTDPNRDVNDFVQQARGALRFYKLLIDVNEEVGDMTDLRLQMRKLEEILITEHNIAIYDRI